MAGGRENKPPCSPLRWDLLPRVIPEGCEDPPNHGAARGAQHSPAAPHFKGAPSDQTYSPYYLQHVLFKHSLAVATEMRAKTKTRLGSIHALIASPLSYLPAILQSEKA